MNNKCLILDIDGTLFDTRIGIIEALNAVLAQYGKEKIKAKDELKFIGPPIKESFVQYCGFNDELADEATKLYRELYVERFIQKSSLYDGARSLINNMISCNVEICIATMKTKAQVDTLLNEFNIYNCFVQIECAAEEGGVTKAQMVERIKNNCEANIYYFVGDTVGDYNAAKASDVIFVAADYGYGDVEYIDCIHIKSIGDLEDVL